MPLLIDANNLAGKMGILEENNFDEILVDLIKKYISKTGKKIILVFDSIDSMGDKRQEGSLMIIYSPKDEYYQNADVKIIELIKNPEKIKSSPSELSMVTDDRVIIEKAKEAGIRVIGSEDFCATLNGLSPKEQKSEKEINDRERDAINKELLKEWS